MMADTFKDLIEKERARVNQQRKMLLVQRADLDRQIAELDIELSAIEAYENAKRGKKPSRARAAQKDGKRAQILQLIGTSEGLTRGQLIDLMTTKGDKSGEQSVSNALSILKKRGKLKQSEGGRYLTT
jgi:hypothetical protein